MSIAIEHRPTAESLLQRRDARWLIVALVPSMIAVAFLRELAPLLIATIIAIGLLALARPSRDFLWSRLSLLAFALVPFLVVVPFVVDRGEVLVSWGWARITDQGLIQAGALLLRSLVITLLGLTLLASAPFHNLIAALGRLGAPRIVTQIMLLTYRYLFMLVEELNRLRVALRCRAFRNVASRHAYRTVGQVAGTLIVRGADRAERVAVAMQCRGMNGPWRTLKPYKTDSGDLLLALCSLGLMGGLVLWDRLT